VAADIVDHLSLAGVVAHDAAIGFDTRGRLHIAEAPSEQSDQLAIDPIDPGADLEHRLASFGRKCFRHGVALLSPSDPVQSTDGAGKAFPPK